MPDLYDELVAFRPSAAGELLPAGTSDHVVHAVRASRRRRVVAFAAAGTALALVSGLVLWQVLPRSDPPLVAATPSAVIPSAPVTPTSTTETQVQSGPAGRAVVVRTPTPLSATAEPRPLANRRVASGALLLQVDGGQLLLCVGPVAQSLPPRCTGHVVSGVNWDQITWKERQATTTWATVDVVAVLSGTGFSSSIAVQQIGPFGTFVVTSDRQAPDPTLPSMTCLRSSDLGGITEGATGTETVSGYQAAWVNARGYNVATVANPATVEKQVRALGYRGPLCVGALPGPSHAELAAAQQAIVTLDGVSGTSIDAGDPVHLEVEVVVSTPEVVAQIKALVAAKSPTGTVVITPEFLTIT